MKVSAMSDKAPAQCPELGSAGINAASMRGTHPPPSPAPETVLCLVMLLWGHRPELIGTDKHDTVYNNTPPKKSRVEREREG